MKNSTYCRAFWDREMVSKDGWDPDTMTKSDWRLTKKPSSVEQNSRMGEFLQTSMRSSTVADACTRRSKDSKMFASTHLFSSPPPSRRGVEFASMDGEWERIVVQRQYIAMGK